jgi:hypothetical protein
MIDDPPDRDTVAILPPGPSEPDTCNTDPPRAPRSDHPGSSIPFGPSCYECELANCFWDCPLYKINTP